MLIDARALISASQISPDRETQYVVAWIGIHQTLEIGDVVVMSETPNWDNVFVRLSDLTIHRLQDQEGHYVLVAPSPKPRRKKKG